MSPSHRTNAAGVASDACDAESGIVKHVGARESTFDAASERCADVHRSHRAAVSEALGRRTVRAIPRTGRLAFRTNATCFRTHARTRTTRNVVPARPPAAWRAWPGRRPLAASACRVCMPQPHTSCVPRPRSPPSLPRAPSLPLRVPPCSQRSQRSQRPIFRSRPTQRAAAPDGLTRWNKLCLHVSGMSGSMSPVPGLHWRWASWAVAPLYVKRVPCRSCGLGWCRNRSSMQH